MLGEHLDANPVDDIAVNLTSPASERRQNTAQRHSMDAVVVLRPASTSARDSEELHGRSRDLSATGCGLVARRAPRVGDIYRIETPEDASHPLNAVNARCVRCHLLDEDTFHAGFAFFTAVHVDSPVTGTPQWDSETPLV